MNNKKHRWLAVLLLAAVLVLACGTAALAEGASGDNSLSSLGIITEGAKVSPEFYYSTIEYNVTVPAGTAKLELDPVPSNGNAWIVDITGQDLVNGETTVVITVSAENGSQYSYYLYVTEDPDSTAAAAAAEATAQTEPAQTEPETEEETEPETEDPRYVRVDRNALEEANNTIEALKTETSSYRDRVGLLTRILYGLIGLCVILLFAVINLVLKKRDLKNELQNYMGYGYDGQEQGRYTPEQSYVQQEYMPEQAYGEPVTGEEPYSEVAYEDQAFAEMPARTERPETPAKQKKKKNNDDPADIPKPSKAKKKAKQMPEYDRPKPEPKYNPPKQGQKSEDVEITMIDL